MKIGFAGRVAAGDELLDTDLRDLAVLSTGTQTLLYAATGQSGGISAWVLAPDGGPARLADSTYFTVAGPAVGPLAALTVDGAPQLILSGAAAGQLAGYGLDEAGEIAAAEGLDLPGPKGAVWTAPAALALGDGSTALYAVDAGTGQIAGWQSDGAGGIAGGILRDGLKADFRLEGQAFLTTAQAGKADFLLAADRDGVQSFRIGADGALRPADDLGANEGLGIAAPTAIAAIEAFGSTWVLVAAAVSQSISVMRLAPDGGLAPADHLLDTLATRFGGVAALEVVEIGGRVLVLAGGADDGLSLFTLLPSGRLVHLDSLAHDTGLGLENVTGIEAAVTGDDLQIFVTSGTEAGISQLSLPLGAVGRVMRGAAEGGAGGDLMVMPAGRGALDGGGGDDVLVTGSTGGVLTGGAGADTFVIRPALKPVVIADFEPGTDRIDLSHIPMLRSADQLKVTERADGILLETGDLTIRVHKEDGSALTLEDIWPGGFDTPDRIPFAKGPVGDFSTGTRRDDRMKGGDGSDIMRGKGGDDRIKGGGEDDRLAGNRGDDLVNGGAGRDMVKGHGGADRLIGGAGADRIAGGAGADRLTGGAGDDTMTGGGGADQFRFAKGHGTDRIAGFDPGQDTLWLKTGTGAFEDLDIRAEGGDTVIDTGAGQIVLKGVSPDELSAEDFLFN